MDHIGISVANLERSLAFYRDLLGMEVVFHGTFEGAQYEKILALRGASGTVVLLKAPNLQIELFEFTHPSPKPGDPDRAVCDHGITHFCIEVPDLQSKYEQLKAAGVSFHCAPLDFGTAKATYGRDPDGNVFELLELSEAAKPE